MRRRTFLAASIGGLTAVAGCLEDNSADETPSVTPSPLEDGTATTTPTPVEDGTPDPSKALINGSFETGLHGWTIGRDLPAKPGNPDQKVGSDADVTAKVAANGYQSVEFFLDGSADDGTIWVQQPVDLSGVHTLAVDGYVENESFNTIAKVAVYTGPEPEGSLVEADFNRDNATEDHQGWKTYEYDVDHDGPGLVGVGISVVWETDVYRQLDRVRLHRE